MRVIERKTLDIVEFKSMKIMRLISNANSRKICSELLTSEIPKKMII